MANIKSLELCDSCYYGIDVCGGPERCYTCDNNILKDHQPDECECYCNTIHWHRECTRYIPKEETK